MKLLRVSKNSLAFLLNSRDKKLLLEMLELYPLVPAAHHRLTRPDDPAPSDENQRLLEESLAEQRRENRKQVQAMLQQPDRFRAIESGIELRLQRTEVEWLLQVLNDVRVGSWLALGEPEQELQPQQQLGFSKENLRYYVALEVCGMFQSNLLDALGIRESPEWAG
jgi:hypothetical protein